MTAPSDATTSLPQDTASNPEAAAPAAGSSRPKTSKASKSKTGPKSSKASASPKSAKPSKAAQAPKPSGIDPLMPAPALSTISRKASDPQDGQKNREAPAEKTAAKASSKSASKAPLQPEKASADRMPADAAEEASAPKGAAAPKAPKPTKKASKKKPQKTAPQSGAAESSPPAAAEAAETQEKTKKADAASGLTPMGEPLNGFENRKAFHQARHNAGVEALRACWDKRSCASDATAAAADEPSLSAAPGNPQPKTAKAAQPCARAQPKAKAPAAANANPKALPEKPASSVKPANPLLCAPPPVIDAGEIGRLSVSCVSNEEAPEPQPGISFFAGASAESAESDSSAASAEPSERMATPAAEGASAGAALPAPRAIQPASHERSQKPEAQPKADPAEKPQEACEKSEASQEPEESEAPVSFIEVPKSRRRIKTSKSAAERKKSSEAFDRLIADESEALLKKTARALQMTGFAAPPGFSSTDVLKRVGSLDLEAEAPASDDKDCAYEDAVERMHQRLGGQSRDLTSMGASTGAAQEASLLAAGVAKVAPSEVFEDAKIPAAPSSEEVGPIESGDSAKAAAFVAEERQALLEAVEAAKSGQTAPIPPTTECELGLASHRLWGMFPEDGRRIAGILLDLERRAVKHEALQILSADAMDPRLSILGERMKGILEGLRIEHDRFGRELERDVKRFEALGVAAFNPEIPDPEDASARPKTGTDLALEALERQILSIDRKLAEWTQAKTQALKAAYAAPSLCACPQAAVPDADALDAFEKPASACRASPSESMESALPIQSGASCAGLPAAPLESTPFENHPPLLAPSPGACAPAKKRPGFLSRLASGFKQNRFAGTAAAAAAIGGIGAGLMGWQETDAPAIALLDREAVEAQAALVRLAHAEPGAPESPEYARLDRSAIDEAVKAAIEEDAKGLPVLSKAEFAQSEDGSDKPRVLDLTPRVLEHLGIGEADRRVLENAAARGWLPPTSNLNLGSGSDALPAKTAEAAQQSTSREDERANDHPSKRRASLPPSFANLGTDPDPEFESRRRAWEGFFKKP